MRLFYFKEKPTTPLHHGSKKKHMFQWKKCICKKMFVWVEIIEAFMKTKENGKNKCNIQGDEQLTEEVQKYPCLYDKENKG